MQILFATRFYTRLSSTLCDGIWAQGIFKFVCGQCAQRSTIRYFTLYQHRGLISYSSHYFCQ